jgi:twitching motility protein PilT
MVSESLRGLCSQLLLPSTDGKSMALVYEILVNTTAIGHLIREQRVHQIRGLMQTGKQQHMILMDECLIDLARKGRISKEMVRSHGEDMKYIEIELATIPD